MKLVAIVLSLALTACASTPGLISGNDQSPVKITNPTIVTDLQSATYNLDQAVAVGALTADDPAPKCLHDVLVKAGIEVPAGAPPVKSFVPKYDGAASAGAVAYILAQQAKATLGKGITVDVSCEALLGRVVIDGANNAAKVIPILPALLK